MTLETTAKLSALNAIIKFDGITVGQLQDITIEEDYGIKTIPEIGSNYNAAYIPGTFTGKISAKRAFIENDIFFDALLPGLTSSNAIADIATNIFGGNAIQIDNTKKTLEALTEFYKGLFLGKSPKDRWNFVLYFDIDIINPSGSNNKEELVYNAKNCVMTSKSLNVSIGNVIIMQNISAFFQMRGK